MEPTEPRHVHHEPAAHATAVNGTPRSATRKSLDPAAEREAPRCDLTPKATTISSKYKEISGSKLGTGEEALVRFYTNVLGRRKIAKSPPPPHHDTDSPSASSASIRKNSLALFNRPSEIGRTYTIAGPVVAVPAGNRRSGFSGGGLMKKSASVQLPSAFPQKSATRSDNKEQPCGNKGRPATSCLSRTLRSGSICSLCAGIRKTLMTPKGRAKRGEFLTATLTMGETKRMGSALSKGRRKGSLRDLNGEDRPKPTILVRASGGGLYLKH